MYIGLTLNLTYHINISILNYFVRQHCNLQNLFWKWFLFRPPHFSKIVKSYQYCELNYLVTLSKINGWVEKCDLHKIIANRDAWENIRGILLKIYQNKLLQMCGVDTITNITCINIRIFFKSTENLQDGENNTAEQQRKSLLNIYMVAFILYSSSKSVIGKAWAEARPLPQLEHCPSSSLRC